MLKEYGLSYEKRRKKSGHTDQSHTKRGKRNIAELKTRDLLVPIRAVE